MQHLHAQSTGCLIVAPNIHHRVFSDMRDAVLRNVTSTTPAGGLPRWSKVAGC